MPDENPGPQPKPYDYWTCSPKHHHVIGVVDNATGTVFTVEPSMPNVPIDIEFDHGYIRAMFPVENATLEPETEQVFRITGYTKNGFTWICSRCGRRRRWNKTKAPVHAGAI